ncbi:MAG: dockerin type I domain-containing protein [Usitatibacteraceae bacterium]
MTYLTKLTLGCACLTASVLACAAGQTSANFAIPKDTINAGVGNMSSANFSLSSSVGEAIAGGTITSVSFQLASGFRASVSVSPAVLNLLSVVSRKIHGTTPFELTIDHTIPITGLVTVEPRTIGAGHTLVFHFDNTVTAVGAASAIDALAAVAGTATVAASGNDAIVTLTNVTDNKRLTVTVTGINGTGTAAASMGFLVGDVNNTRTVNSSDISGVKARSGQTTTALNFQFDVNATGAVNSSDISAVKARSGTTLAP